MTDSPAQPIFVEICDHAISEAFLREMLSDPDAGAVGWFHGVTRRTTRHAAGDQVTETLHYEAHESMAMRQLEDLARSAAQRFGLQGVVICHRIGEVPIGEASVIVGCLGGHRKEVFAALPWIMDQLKRDVAIWKQETFVDGEKQWVHPQSRIYLDHAATSWPKSESVIDAISQFSRECGATAGRGNYRSAMKAGDVVNQARRRLAKLINAEDAMSISLHSSGTAALNTAIHGLIRNGDHVVTTAAEHNSVLRPLKQLSNDHDVQLEIAPVDKNGRVDVAELMRLVRPHTRMVAVTGASNVTGMVQPIKEIGGFLQPTDAIFLCDAAQSFGLLPIDVKAQGVDVLAAPGHKGSRGPGGTAMLYVHHSLHDEVKPSIQGGTGSVSESMQMPTTMPEKLEAGSINVALLAGWLVALNELQDCDWESRQATLKEMARQLYDGLQGIPDTQIHGTADGLPIVSMTMDSLAPSDLASILDQEHHIETRSGFHCAAAIHPYIGSAPSGTLRISAGFETTTEEIQHVVSALQRIASAMQAV